MNHEVEIIRKGNHQATIMIDGREVAGVTAYRIEEGVNELPRVTFTVLAETIVMRPYDPAQD